MFIGLPNNALASASFKMVSFLGFHLSERYNDLLAPMVKAIQEQQAQIDEQKKMMAEQQKQIEELKLLILSMKK